MANTIEITGFIKHLFKDCPKPGGWFGCYFATDGYRFDIKVIGITPMPIAKGVLNCH